MAASVYLDSLTQDPIPEGRLISYEREINGETQTRHYSLDTLVRFVSAENGGFFDPIDRQAYPVDVEYDVIEGFCDTARPK